MEEQERTDTPGNTLPYTTNRPIGEQHREMVKALVKDPKEILHTITPQKAGLLKQAIEHFISIGVVLDRMKAHVIYNKPLPAPASEYGLEEQSFDYHGWTAEQVDLLHASIGIADEAYELLEAVYSHLFKDADLDKDNMLEEAGDSEFYWEALRKNLEFSRTDALKANMEKLAKRYQSFKYSDQQAITRADKARGLGAIIIPNEQ